MNNKYKVKKVIYIKLILILIFILSVSYIVYKLIEVKTNKCDNSMQKLLEEITIYDKDSNKSSMKTKRQLQLSKLQKQNNDIIAWLEIYGTNISYPVLYGDDNDFYVTHNYKKEKSKDGALFLDAGYNLKLPSTNLLIYGHNNQNGKMFSLLEKYKDKKFYKAHTKIRYTTIEDEIEFEIIAVFYSRVYYQYEQDVFRYYYFIDANDEKEYNHYISNCKKSSIYNIEKTAKYNEQLLTLSTCSYHTKNGRFVVVARKI